MNINKTLVFFGLLLCYAHKIQTAQSKIVCVSDHLGKVGILHCKSGFSVVEKDCIKPVQNCFVDKGLRGISKENLSKALACGYLSAQRMSDGEYTISHHVCGKGGGFWGAVAGCFVGKAVVSVVGHGTIWIVSAGIGVFCPPAGVAAGIALESTCGAMIEAASIKGAIAGGIIGGVATGPV